MKFFIVGPEHGGEGVYSLVTEEGEGLASHLCSNANYAYNDLIGKRPERQKEWIEEFGGITSDDVKFVKDFKPISAFLNIGVSDITTSNEIVELNKRFHKQEKKECEEE